MTDIQRLVYLAAVLDYNGSIGMKSVRKRLIPYISVHTSNAEAAEMLIKAFGGRLSRRKSGVYVFQRSYAGAADVVRLIRPYLVLITTIADQVLDWMPADKDQRLRNLKTPCPYCTKPMTAGSKVCFECFKASDQKVLYKPAHIPEPAAHKTRTGTGEVTTVGRVQTHRMRI